ncbi:hypothetical protein MSP8887_03393 [Marinomonas spartinae]|nr:hypothetical protein MSP8887_03393 [Marinomonas spartinae]
MIMLIYCITAALWSLSSVGALAIFISIFNLELTEDTIGVILASLLGYMFFLQILNALMLRYYSWARWWMASISLLSIVLTVACMMNVHDSGQSIYYLASLILVTSIWSCFYFSSFLWVRFIQRQAKRYQSVHGHDPIQWRANKRKNLF